MKYWRLNIGYFLYFVQIQTLIRKWCICCCISLKGVHNLTQVQLQNVNLHLYFSALPKWKRKCNVPVPFYLQCLNWSDSAVRKKLIAVLPFSIALFSSSFYADKKGNALRSCLHFLQGYYIMLSLLYYTIIFNISECISSE